MLNNTAFFECSLPEATSAVRASAHRHPHETFTWLQWEWDIAAFWRDHDAGKLNLKRHVLNRDFIVGYAEQVLCQDAEQPAGPTRLSFLMHVDVAAAQALPDAALTEPVLFLPTPKLGRGILRLEGQNQVNHVLADGNHRVVRAYHAGTPELFAYTLTPALAKKYLLQ